MRSWFDRPLICLKCAAASERPGAGVTYRPSDRDPCAWCGTELVVPFAGTEPSRPTGPTAT